MNEYVGNFHIFTIKTLMQLIYLITSFHSFESKHLGHKSLKVELVSQRVDVI